MMPRGFREERFGGKPLAQRARSLTPSLVDGGAAKHCE